MILHVFPAPRRARRPPRDGVFQPPLDDPFVAFLQHGAGQQATFTPFHLSSLPTDPTLPLWQRVLRGLVRCVQLLVLFPIFLVVFGYMSSSSRYPLAFFWQHLKDMLMGQLPPLTSTDEFNEYVLQWDRERGRRCA